MAKVPSNGAPPPTPRPSAWVGKDNKQLFETHYDNIDGSYKLEGVGGEQLFWLAPLDLDGSTILYNQAVKFDLLPARNSFFERQGQRIPDVGAGLNIQTTFNLAKLKIPGARPVYQQMGVDEEMIEMVGAFVGFDVETYEETIHNTGRLGASEPSNGRTNAFYQAINLLSLINQGRPLAILMSVGQLSSENRIVTPLQMVNHAGEAYRGFAKACRIVYATEQRVYWKLLFAITNRTPSSGLVYGDKVPVPPGLIQAGEVSTSEVAGPGGIPYSQQYLDQNPHLGNTAQPGGIPYSPEFLEKNPGLSSRPVVPSKK